MRLPPQPLTDHQRRRACALLAAGATRTSAAKFAGCRRLDLDAEIKRDPVFKQHVRQSELQPEMQSMRTLLAAASDPKQWRAAAWALERMYPRRYGASKREAVPPAELRKFVAQHAKERDLRRIVQEQRAAEKKKKSAHAKARSTRRDLTKESAAKHHLQ